MNQEKKPEELQSAIRSMMTRIETLHAENVSQRAQLVAEAARTAEEKLRADQMTEQHRMQCNISKSAVATLVGLGYTDRGGEQWAPPIGKAPDFNLLDAANARIAELETARFAYASEFEPNTDGDPDVGSIHANIRALKAQLSAIGAGGVEALRKRDQECGNCFEGKSDLDHTCRKCAGSAISPAQEHATQHATQLAGQGQEDARDALTLADQAWNFDSSAYESTRKANAEMLCKLQDCAQTIRSQHARIAELEAQAQPARAASDVQAIKLGMQAHEEAASKHCTGTTNWAWCITRFYERAHGITKETT